MNNVGTLFEKFIRERQYINNLSPRTIRYSQSCFDSFRVHIAPAGIHVESMDPDDLSNEVLQDYVIGLAKSGVKPISIDSYIRGLNCFLSWLERGGHITQRLRLPRPRFELELPRTLNQTEIRKLVQLKPRSRTMRRVHAIALVCLDTGCRVKEVLGLRFADVDLDAMVIRVLGKGRRERLIPFSPELRRLLFRWVESERASRHSSELVFATRDGLTMRYDNLRRDYRKLLGQAGIENPGGFHKLRHTFATEFIRSGRGEILLSRILGHTTLDMTRRYVQSNVEDLRGCSPLTRAR
jgi:integrase/recombinase XerD